VMAPNTPAPPNLLLALQAKLQQILSSGLDHGANLCPPKEMAKTVLYLQGKGLTDFTEFEKACDAAAQKFHTLTGRSQAIQARLQEISALQKHLGTYAKTHAVYAQHRNLTGRKQTKFYEQHTSAITACQAAKRYFASLGLRKLPSIQSLQQESAALQVEGRKIYPDFKRARTEMIELLTAKQNVERMLSVTEKDRLHDHQPERG